MKPAAAASRTVGALVLTVGAVGLTGTAQAHVSLHPNTVPAGAFATLDMRVPGEQQDAHVKKVDVLFPPGFTSVDYENVAGWKVKVSYRRLPTAIQTDDGPVDEDVSQIVWAWNGPLGQVSDGQFIDFPLSVAIPDDLAGRSLRFKTIQTYSNGYIDRWIDESLDAEHPAPTINITHKGGIVQDVAGEEAGPQPDQLPVLTSPAASKASGGASQGLGIAALVMGALGLLAGALAFLAGRRANARAGR